MTQESTPNPTGTVRLYAPDGASWNGIFYTPDADDIVEVPAAAADDLLSFPPICPEAARPEPEPLPWDPETDARHAREIAAGLKEQGRAEMRADLKERDERIAELEEQLRVARQPARTTAAAEPAEAKHPKPTAKS